MLASRIGSFDGLHVADLYAGSGALGFEALSRGAATCLFMDRDPAAQQAIRANAASLGCSDRVEIRAGLGPAGAFDVVFADPPYGSGEADRIVGELLAQELVRPGGWLAVETAPADLLDPRGLEIAADRRAGRARIRLLRRTSTSTTPS